MSLLREDLEYDARETERAEAEYYAAEAKAADEQYQHYLAERGISEDEHLEEVSQWCDQQD